MYLNSHYILKAKTWLLLMSYGHNWSIITFMCFYNVSHCQFPSGSLTLVAGKKQLSTVPFRVIKFSLFIFEDAFISPLILKQYSWKATYLFERQGDGNGEMEREILQLLVHSPKGHNSQGRAQKFEFPSLWASSAVLPVLSQEAGPQMGQPEAQQVFWPRMSC